MFRLVCPVSVTTGFSLLGLFPVTATEETKHTTSMDYLPQNTGTMDLSQIKYPVEEITPIGQGMASEINHGNMQGGKVEHDGLDDVAASVIKWNPMLMAAMIWLTGAIGIFLYSVIQLIRIQRDLVGAVCLKEKIYLADYIDSPFVMGLIFPKIYLPSNLSEQELEYIILHEKHHIRRGDHIIKWLSFLTLCVHWFNPLVWVAFVLSGKDMEMSCDEAVIKKMGEDICQEYSASLLSLATGKRIIAGTPLAFGEGNTKSRIKNVLKWRKPKVWISVLAVIFCLTAVILCVGNPRVGAKADGLADDVSEEYNQSGDDDAENADSGNEVMEQGNEYDSVPTLSPKQGEYGSVEDVAFYFELAALGNTFRDMGTEQSEELLKEYEGLLENYTLIARESVDGKAAYIVGVYNEASEKSVLYGKYCMELGIGEDNVVWLLYDAKDEGTVNAAIGEGKYPEEGYIIKNSEIYFSPDYDIVLIQPRETMMRFDTVFNRYLYTPNGRTYMIDAASRGIDLVGCEEPYVYVYLISEKFGEIAERIPITEAQAKAIMAEERVKLAKGYGFCASLHYNGDTTYYTEMTKAPQSVIDLAMERCNYKFATPEDMDGAILEAALECGWLEETLYVSENDLGRLQEILTNAESGFVGGCGYGAKLILTLDSGEKITVFKGCDGCDSMVFGSYGGYFIGDKANEEFWRMFGLDPETKERIEE